MEDSKRSREEIIESITKTQEEINDLNAKIKELQSKHRYISGWYVLIRSAGQNEYMGQLNKVHKYNDMKDIGQMLLGQLASVEGETTKEMYKRFGMNLDD